MIKVKSRLVPKSAQQSTTGIMIKYVCLQFLGIKGGQLESLPEFVGIDLPPDDSS